jgi:nitroimidazol reductase NimA-like FMN-containing flavoprotein (pyridoxamine 5'-phosphate oxidase superfamily)
MKPHHGTMKELCPVECLDLLKRNQAGHLACHDQNELYLIPVSYIFDDGFIYSYSKPGKKIEIMRKHPHVCIQVEEVKDFFHWKSVIAWGRFEELKSEEAAVAMRRLVKKLAIGEERRSDLELYFESQIESDIIYRIQVEKTTGRSEGDFES